MLSVTGSKRCKQYVILDLSRLSPPRGKLENLQAKVTHVQKKVTLCSKKWENSQQKKLGLETGPPGQARDHTRARARAYGVPDEVGH